MDPRLLKNPTSKVIEVTRDGRVTIFNPGEIKPVETGLAKLALEFNNTALIDVTDKPSFNAEHNDEVMNRPDYTKMSMAKLLKEAKANGLKSKFGMTKNEVITLLLNGQPKT